MPPLMGFWLRGSPPRGRGKAELSAAIDHVLGITPAYAGKRRRISCSPTRSRDHPRIGGEKICKPPRYFDKLGSPPHGRGKEASIFDDGQRLGITPAWAGKSRSAISAHSVGQDHPRVGEEKFEDVRNIVGQIGSSPRRRGKDGNEVQLIAAEGITPAWAGKRQLQSDCSPSCQDHPRVGGEKPKVL